MSIRFPVLVSVLTCLSSTAAAGTLHVKRNAGPGGDGQSWGTAFQLVQDALAAAQSGDEIWVAKNTYRPGNGSSPRTVTFQIPPGIRLYGGFVGGETSRSQRNWIANETILSGDLRLDDAPGFVNRTDNCYHVVTMAGGTLDGFTIRGGNAGGGGNASMGGGMYVTGGGPTLANLRFIDNRAGGHGGAMWAYGSLDLADSLFEGNHADYGGGAVYAPAQIHPVRCVLRSNHAGTTGGAVFATAGLSFTDSLFEGNDADAGGAVYTETGISFVRCVLRSNHAGTGGSFYSHIGGEAVFSNCLVTGNTAGTAGGLFGIYTNIRMYNCTVAANHAENIGGAGVDGLTFLFLYNSIVWGNTDTTHSSVYEQNVYGESLHFTAVQGAPPPWDRDPVWVDPLGPDGVGGTADDDLRLSCLSPYIDAGTNNYVQAGPALDLAARLLDDPAVQDTGAGTAPIVDLGPYEFACGCTDVQPYCTALANSTGGAASIGWSGSTSRFANSFTLLASGAPPLKSGLFFYGSTQTNVLWGDGIRCVGGSLQRLAVLQTDAAGNASFHLDFTLPPAGSGPRAIFPGSTWNFQFMFRDPPGGPAGWNSTDAFAAQFCP